MYGCWTGGRKCIDGQFRFVIGNKQFVRDPDEAGLVCIAATVCGGAHLSSNGFKLCYSF